MKRIICFIISLAILICLYGCHADLQNPTDPPTEPIATEPTATDPPPTEPQWPGYTGPKGEYTYFYEEERDAQWEEDVVYFANSYLGHHPLLSDRRYLIYYPSEKSDNGKFYDETLQKDFIAGINALIPEISQLTDNQIIGRMMMLLALLEDAHTGLGLPSSDLFPISFIAMYEEDEYVYYVNILPSEHEDLLFTTLVSINGYPLNDIIEQIRSIRGIENDYGLYGSCGNGYLGGDLANNIILETLGIIDPGSSSVVYTLQMTDGTTTDLELDLVGNKRIRYVSHTPEDAYSVSYGTASNNNYWFTTTLDNHTLFLRINSFQVDAYNDYGTLGNKLNLAYQQEDGFDKIIIDLRDNGGGYTGFGYMRLLTVLRSYDCSNIYILINSGSYSQSTFFVADVMNMLEGVTIVGTPSGQNTEFYAGMTYEYVMPNSEIICKMPTGFCDIFPEEECGRLIPDVVIWPTIEDYLNCTDAILEYVLNQ